MTNVFQTPTKGKIRCVNAEEAVLVVRTDVQLRILLPTLNRPAELVANVSRLLCDLRRVSKDQEIQVVISENGSNPDLLIDCRDLSNRISSILADTAHAVLLVRRSNRLSLGEHMRWLHELPSAPWVMWLGDDDLLSPTYLAVVSEVIDGKEGDDVGVVIPGYGPIDATEFFALASSSEQFFPSPDVIKYDPGPGTVLNLAGRGHQLSGLTFCTKYLAGVGEMLSRKNVFPWMCWIAGVAQSKAIVFVQGRHARITNDTPKLFSYGTDGLFPDIVEAIFSGCNNDRCLAVRTASNVLKRGMFRLERTTTTPNQRLLNYLRLWHNPFMDHKVFLKVLPSVLYSYVRRWINT